MDADVSTRQCYHDFPRSTRGVRMSMRSWAAAMCIMGPCALDAQAAVWQPSPGHTQVAIWPGSPPHAAPGAPAESATTRLRDHLVAGKPWTYITNVSRPTLTVYSPKGKNTGAA